MSETVQEHSERMGIPLAPVYDWTRLSLAQLAILIALSPFILVSVVVGFVCLLILGSVLARV